MASPEKPDENGRKFQRLVGFIGILLIIVGQYFIFIPAVENAKLPPKTFLISIVGFVLFVGSYFIRFKPSPKHPLQFLEISAKAKWVFASILFAILTTFSMVLFVKKGQSSFIPVITTWFASGIFFIVAFLEKTPTFLEMKQWLKNHRSELFLLGGITAVGFFFRFYKLGELPMVIDGDEGLLGLTATAATSGNLANPFALWENFGAIYLQAVHIAIRIFGNTAFAVRILPAISGTLAIPALYLFSRQIAGKKVALISAFLIAVSHSHINFSRIGSVGYIHSTWLVPLELFLLYTGLVKRKSWMTAAGGVLLAFHFSVYLTSQVIFGLVLVFMLILFIFKRKWFLSVRRQAGAFWGGFSVMILPELAYIIQNPHQFTDRLHQDGIFQSDWIALTIANTGQSTLEVLVGRVVHAFLSLIYYPAIDFYGSNLPMLTLFASVFFIAGLGIALLRVRDTGMLLLNGYFWAITVAIGLLSIPPSADSYRMLSTLPAAFTLTAIAINEVLTLLGVGWIRDRKKYIFVTAGLLISLAIMNIWTYFGDFVGQCRYSGDLSSRFASYLGAFSNDVDQGSNLFLLSDGVYRYGTHASTDFLSGQRQITNINDPIDQWVGTKGDTVIASPNRIAELDSWILSHPGGQTKIIHDCKFVILKAYQVP